ncbi:MAG: DUF3313 domain-containing protein [Deltaproteobacteria bacterium]|nr:DUF3313 domain-containing protein [Deltaproteobacteria bacterium]
MSRIFRRDIVAMAVAWLILVLVGAMITGCAKTVEEQSAVVQQAQSGSNAAIAGFFGNDLSLLQPGQPGQAAMIYLNPNAQWQQYNKIIIEPVQFWDDPDTKVSPSDQHVLTSYFYNQLQQELQKNFTIVNEGGPGTLQLQVALVNTKAATPGLRTVSVIVPQARIINLGQSLATGSYAFAGSAEAEMKLTDSSTGQLLAGAIDQRSGGMAISTAAQWQWGDAENAMNYWATKISSRLLQLQGRAPTPSS